MARQKRGRLRSADTQYSRVVWRSLDGRLNLVRESLRRPYRVTPSMVALLSLVPLYIAIAHLVTRRPLHAPELSLDRAFPVVPAWALVYGALYLFLIVLPVFVVRQDELLRHTVFAYLSVWIAAYAVFLAYPTVAPRPTEVMGDGFAVWGLRFLYEADPPLNCFPSLHVAHSFVSALACLRVHRGVGALALGCASVVGLSTLFTKQHYVLDVLAGMLLAAVAYAIFLRGRPHSEMPDLDRRVAPVFVLGLLGVIAAGVGGVWLAYRLGA